MGQGRQLVVLIDEVTYLILYQVRSQILCDADAACFVTMHQTQVKLYHPYSLSESTHSFSSMDVKSSCQFHRPLLSINELGFRYSCSLQIQSSLFRTGPNISGMRHPSSIVFISKKIQDL